MIQASAPISPVGTPVTHVYPRIESVDLLRGMVIILMALDHVRDFFSNALFSPTDLTQTNPTLFLTRWVTHFVAPAFVLLTGTGAFLSTVRRAMTKTDLAWFLLTRGLWLIFLELTIVRFGWTFNFDYHYTFGAVIWVLGWSMIVLAGLVFLPTWAVALFGVMMIAGHNLFDTVHADGLGAFGWLWKVIHSPGPIELLSGFSFFVFYPLIPWIGVIAAGYGLGTVFLLEQNQRRKYLLSIGIVLILSFVLIRIANLYGDPRPWSVQKDGLFTLFSFINCEKYPPSLLYLLMTLGPVIAALAAFERKLGYLGHVFVIYGKVPLYYYLLHLLLIHALAVGLAYIRYGQIGWLFEGSGASPFPTMPIPDYGYDLPVVYLIWVGVVILFFPICRWFGGVKQRQRDVWWLRYL